MNCKNPECKNEVIVPKMARRPKFYCSFKCGNDHRYRLKHEKKKRVINPEFIAECKKLNERGFSRSQIASMVKASKTSVSVAINGNKRVKKEQTGFFDWVGSEHYYRCFITGFLLSKK